jgi:O-antigen/teichoic acid export membrane protein
LHSLFNYTTLLLQQLALWITALSGYGLVVAASLMLVVRILTASLITVWLFRRHQTLKPGFRYANRDHLRTLLKPALANMAMPLAQGLNIQGMVLVLGATLGPVAVVVFSTLRTLTRFALQMVLSISHTFEPELAAAWGRDEKNLLLRLYINNLRLGFWLSLGVVASLFFLGDWIVKVWTHGKVPMDSGLFNWLLISAMASVLWYGGLNLLKAANRHLRAAVWYVFSSLAAVLLAAILLRNTSELSTAGPALVVMDVLMTVYVFRSAAHSIGTPTWSIMRSMLDLRSLVREIYLHVAPKPMGGDVW